MHRLKSRLTIKISKVLCFTLLLKTEMIERTIGATASQSVELLVLLSCDHGLADWHTEIFSAIFIKIIFRTAGDWSFFLL